jgi:hypothetical protein
MVVAGDDAPRSISARAAESRPDGAANLLGALADAASRG